MEFCRIDLASLVGREYRKSLLEGDPRIKPRGMKHHSADNFDLHYAMLDDDLPEDVVPKEKHVMLTVRGGIIHRCVVLPFRLYVPLTIEE